MRRFKKTVIFAAVLALSVLVRIGVPVSASAASGTVEVPVTYRQTEARSMLSMINEFRTGSDAWYWNSDNATKTTCSGLSALTYDYDLEKVAMQRAAEIALSFSHTRPDGTACTSAYRDEGYSYSACGENIAAGYTSASGAFTALQEAGLNYSGQGHRRTMLSSVYNVCACACVSCNGRYFWVQEFARTRSPAGSSASAGDGAATVSVRVSTDTISSYSLSASPESITLKEGESTGLPGLTAKISFQNAFPTGSSFTANVSGTWTSANTGCASVSGKKVTAKAAGDTSLAAAFLGKSVQVPVCVRKDFSGCTLTLERTSYAYDGSFREPSVTVKDGSAVLKKDTDYTVAYSSNRDIGTASVTVTGKGTYTGTLSKTFAITVKKGALCTAGDFIYRIADARTDGEGRVTLVGPADKKLKSAAVAANVRIGGVRFRVTRIAAGAFKGCTKLRTVTIGNAVTVIGKQAFYGCTRLKSVTVKRGVTAIGKKAFYNCGRLETITILSRNLTYVGAKALKGIPSDAKITVPGSRRKAYTELFAGKGQSSTVTVTGKTGQ